MANNYYQGTGVLVLKSVTPVISALFGGFHLDGNYPGNGEAYIAVIPEDTDLQWDSIRENLEELATSLGLRSADADDAFIESGQALKDCLRTLAAHYGAGKNEDLSGLIDAIYVESDIAVSEAFEIAVRINDGHDLKALRWEGSWRSARPLLFEFGGDSLYLGEQCQLSSSSSESLLFAHDVDAALESGDLVGAAEHFTKQFNKLLDGVTDLERQERIRVLIAERLVPSAS